MKTILFVVYGGGHVLMLLPVIKKLISCYPYKIEILGCTIAREILEKEGISCFSFRDLIIQGKDKIALQKGRELARGLPDESTLPLSESEAYLGLSFHDLTGLVGPNEAVKLYQEQGRRPMLPFTAINRAIDKIKPDLIVATNSPRAEKASILTAGYRGIKSICVVDLFGIDELPWVGVAGFGNKICLLSEHVKAIFLNYGRPEDEIVITGNPLFDILSDSNMDALAKSFRSKRNWDRKRPVVLWAAQNFPSDHPKAIPIEVFERFASKLKKYDFVLRPHPNDPINSNESSFHNIIFSSQKDDINVLLNSVDIVVTMTSTVGIGAVLAQKPLICIDAGEFTKGAPFVECGMAIHCEDLNALEDAIESALEKGPVSSDELPVPGTATSNLINCIEETIKE
jgi:hypothetical protein